MLHRDAEEKLRRYNINRILAKRREIREDRRFRKLYCSKLAATEVSRLIPLFASHFPGAERSALRESVSLLVGSEINGQTLGLIGWIFAGNEHRLRGGITVAQWTDQPFDEWVPMQILECEPRRARNGKHGAVFTFVVLAGLACAERMKRFWTGGFCGYLSTRLGYSKPWGKTPYKRVEDFVGMQMYGLVEKERSQKYPVFDKIEVLPSLVKRNQKLIKMRTRITFKCPKNYRHPCAACHVGYDQCPCGVHPRTYVKVDCEQCGKSAWTDPRLVELNLCLECHRHNMEKR